MSRLQQPVGACKSPACTCGGKREQLHTPRLPLPRCHLLGVFQLHGMSCIPFHLAVFCCYPLCLLFLFCMPGLTCSCNTSCQSVNLTNYRDGEWGLLAASSKQQTMCSM